MPKRITFTVTNDLSYDQRMQRICSTLATKGYEVTLVGRVLPHSKPLDAAVFRQKRLGCRFHKGILFYGEFNIRLFFYLLTAPSDAVCSIDLDTLPAGCLASLIRRKKRVFDAHEYFSEVPEVVNRNGVKRFWELIARIFLPFYRYAYTVGPGLAAIFEKKYGIPFRVVRNVPVSKNGESGKTVENGPKIIFYQGALNEGRGLETAIDAMQELEGVELWLAGEGDLSAALRARVQAQGLSEKVRFLGFVKPADLATLTEKAWLGINLLENKGLSYYYSLANKFFDYIQASVPVITMDFPEYRALVGQYEVGILLPDLQKEGLLQVVRDLQKDKNRYQQLCENCRQAAKVWNWEQEQQVLLSLWEEVLR